MTLRRRLIYLHTAFALFAALAAVATIYGVQFYVARVAERLEALVDEIHFTEESRVNLKSLDVHLHELVSGRRPMDEAIERQAEGLFTRLGDVVRFGHRELSGTTPLTEELSRLCEALKREVAACFALVREGQLEDARRVFKQNIEERLLGDLDAGLRRIRSVLDEQRGLTSRRLFERNTQLLGISLLVGAGGVALVLAGTLIVRRRLVAPVTALYQATEAFGRGDLEHRVGLQSEDELGALGGALEDMAASLRASQLKFKSLFENQRDAVVVCDPAGHVIECYNGDSNLLGAMTESFIGRCANEVWAHWESPRWSWRTTIGRVLAAAAPVRISDLSIPSADGRGRIVDVVAYPVNYTGDPYVAIVVRDVSERFRLQEMSRRGEAMQAAVTFARGVAHDFKNLLHSAVASLSLIHADSDDPRTRERSRSALNACEQAANLSKRLTRFAAMDQGQPEELSLDETLRLIVESLDESFHHVMDIQLSCGSDCRVRIDRDGLTQIALNLIYNAREAMPDGGTLHISTEKALIANPATPLAASPHVLLTVSDTGQGIPAAERERVFQPLFSTKKRGDHGPRGMGLAIVYAAVTSAAGFIQIDSTVGQGTSFRVYLPAIARQ